MQKIWPKHLHFFPVLCLFISLSGLALAAPDSKKITWLPWSDDIFERAKKENRFVLLDLEAVWCHWCHVMDEKTYSDPKVIALIQSRYLAVRVDQDSRPDLSNRYEDYGWPATIFFAPTGAELVKRSGNIPPEQMASILQAIIDDPTPGPSVLAETRLNVTDSGALGAPLRGELKKSFQDEYDTEYGGWEFGHKYLQADSVEWALHEAANGDKVAEKRARETLSKARVLLDPAWGGVYQYSAEGWNEPHFEKIMSFQADNLRVYSEAYAQWKQPKDLGMAQSIRTYLKTFLTGPAGAFYTSQDADLVQGEHAEAYFKLSDKARRKKGIPRIDTHAYARENGWAADALIVLSMVSGDAQALEEAQRAIDWIEKNRGIAGGGFRHDAEDGGRRYLGDTLAMGQAYLRLYAATGERKWLMKAADAAKFISTGFSFTGDNGKTGGFVTASAKSVFSFRPQRDENISVARFANLLYRYSGDSQHKAIFRAGNAVPADPRDRKTSSVRRRSYRGLGARTGTAPPHHCRRQEGSRCESTFPKGRRLFGNL